jgi:predicted Abi (CAAX) family protease
MSYSIKTVKAGAGLVSKRISEGSRGEATVITAQPGVKYVIAQNWDSYSDRKGAPKKLVSQREGNDLKNCH